MGVVIGIIVVAICITAAVLSCKGADGIAKSASMVNKKENK